MKASDCSCTSARRNINGSSDGRRPDVGCRSARIAPPVPGIPVTARRSNRIASADGNTGDLFALVRDPRSSRQVWSRAQGYPGDEWYLEFHKIRWPDGLRLWRVTGPQVDLGAKRQYDPEAAQTSARNHADHFASVLRETAATRARGKAREGVVTAPFDAELFGHWWFEGVDFLANVYRRLASDGARGTRPGDSLDAARAGVGLAIHHLDRRSGRLRQPTVRRALRTG